MQFVLIDRFEKLEKGKRALARRKFSTEGHPLLYPSTPTRIVPLTLLIESMAQTAGWLLAYSHDFSVYVPLLMVGQAEYQRPVLAGEEVEIEVPLESIQFHAASARAAIRNADQQEMAQGYLMFGIESMDGRETRGESIIPAWKRTGEGRLWLARTWKKLSGEDLPLSAHHPGAAE